MKKLLEFIKKLFGSSTSSDSSNKGFTLIELLIVIAVVGVLAAAVLIALNPLEQFKRARDAGMKQAMSTIGRQIQTNYTLTQQYPASTATWLTTLQTSGQLKVVPDGRVATTCANAGNPAGWSAGQENNICYKENTTAVGNGEFIILAHPEATIETTKGGCVNAAQTWYIYQSSTGKSGTVCNNGEPTIDGTYTYFE